MIPGGVDLVLEGPTSANDWWVLMFEVRQQWPEALFHRTEPGEMFVYRDQDAFRLGLADELPEDGLIHVLMSSESLTIVVDEPPAQTARIGQDVYTALQRLREG